MGHPTIAKPKTTTDGSRDSTDVPEHDHPQAVQLPSAADGLEKQQPSLIRKYRDSDWWLWTEVAAVVIGLAFIIPTGIALWIDLEDRETQRVAQAWELVTRSASGNSGKGPALEYLISKDVVLVGIDLSAETNHGRSFLFGVDLSGADLRDANLAGADIRNANLTEAVMLRANLTGARLQGANFEGTNLRRANLSGANLLSALNLTRKQLAIACGDSSTILPEEGQIIRSC